MIHFSYTRQREPLGLGHAVLAAKELVGDEPFAVLLGDVILSGPPATRELIEVFDATGMGAILVEPVPPEKTTLYGIVATQPGSTLPPEPRWKDRLLKISHLVEKPAPELAPSNLGITGRYVLPPETFDYLEKTAPGSGGEIQLTDALLQLAANQGLWALILEGKSYDAGDKLGFLKATVELGMENPDFGAEFRQYLKTLKF